jgi:hypothetical protein
VHMSSDAKASSGFSRLGSCPTHDGRSDLRLRCRVDEQDGSGRHGGVADGPTCWLASSPWPMMTCSGDCISPLYAGHASRALRNRCSRWTGICRDSLGLRLHADSGHVRSRADHPVEPFHRTDIDRLNSWNCNHRPQAIHPLGKLHFQLLLPAAQELHPLMCRCPFNSGSWNFPGLRLMPAGMPESSS